MRERVWIDESARETTSGVVYVIAGVRLTGDARSSARLRDLLLPGQKYLHWRDEPNHRRREIVGVLNELPLDVTIAVAYEVRIRRQEQARSRCLASVASECLTRQIPVTQFAIEGRGGHLDLRDRFSILDESRRINHRPAPAIEFVPKTASEALWVADAVAYMASTHFSDEPGSDHWWRTLRPSRLTMLRSEG